MDPLKIITERLIITEFDINMAKDVHLNSLDDDNRKYVPDEVFETEIEAYHVISYLISCYNDRKGPYVYPVLLHDGTNIGYVQIVPYDLDFEIGYHIAKAYTKKGYATEALNAFIPHMIKRLNISKLLGICHQDNIASMKVMDKCGFTLLEKSAEDYHGKKQIIYKYQYQKMK
jgi:[ribosomal protein S5]-alanine N-acetyltransferase